MSDEKKSESSGINYVLLFLMFPALYFGFFGLIILDEAVCHTYWIENYFSVSADTLIIIYWPLLKFFGFK